MGDPPWDCAVFKSKMSEVGRFLFPFIFGSVVVQYWYIGRGLRNP